MRCLNATTKDLLHLYEGEWYIVTCLTNYEEKIKDNIVNKLKALGYMEQVYDVRVLKQTIKSTRTGKLVQKPLFPGYIFINMRIDDDLWFYIRNTEGVRGFVGSSGKGQKPFPLSRDEAYTLFYRNELKKSQGEGEGAKKQKFTAAFNTNDYVRVTDTVFSVIREGKVVKMDYNKGIATVEVELFGRLVPSQFPFTECELIRPGVKG